MIQKICLYDKTTGNIIGYFPSDSDIELALSDYPNSDYIIIDATQIPPRNEVGKWKVNITTKELEKII